MIHVLRSGAILALCLIGAASGATPPSTQATVDQILQNIRERRAAVDRGDLAAWQSFVADDSIWSSSSEERATKAEVQREVLKGAGGHHTVEVPRVVLAGDAAAVSYIDVDHEVHNGKPTEIRQVILETHVRRAGRWLMLAQAETPIPPKVVDPPAVSVAPEILDAYVGEYRWNDRQTLKVLREGNRLMFISEAGGPAEEALAEDEVTFYSPGSRWRQIFVRGPDGRVMLTVYRDNGIDFEMPRIR